MLILFLTFKWNYHDLTIVIQTLWFKYLDRLIKKLLIVVVKLFYVHVLVLSIKCRKYDYTKNLAILNNVSINSPSEW